MKITSLFTKGLFVTAIATTMVIGAGVAGASASDGHHERNTSGEDHEQGSDHGHDDDGDEHGVGHESHGRGWGFGHGAGDDEADGNETELGESDDQSEDESESVDTGEDVVVPVVLTPAQDDPSGTTLDTSVLDTPVPAADFQVVVIETSTTEAAALVPEVEAIQPQILVESPELARDEASTPAPNNVNETELSDEAAPSTSERLPMTGASSLFVVGLAASLLAAGWLVIAGRRRKVVA